MFRVRLDGLDDQVELVGTVDFARYAVVAIWRDLLGFGEVMQAVDPVRGVISHEKHGARAVFRPREQGKMVGAQVEHGLGGRAGSSAPPSAPLRGYPADFSVPGYHHRAALSRDRPISRPADSDSCWPCGDCHHQGKDKWRIKRPHQPARLVAVVDALDQDSDQGSCRRSEKRLAVLFFRHRAGCPGSAS